MYIVWRIYEHAAETFSPPRVRPGLNFLSATGPKVSIVIPVYNGADFLRGAIESALAQTYRDIEILVVDDGSDDGGRTQAIAESFGDKIRHFRKEHGGIAATLNFGIGKMTGDYFSWLSHDDEYYPEKIARQVDFLKSLGRPAVVYGDYDLISGRGIILSRVRGIGLKPGHLRYHLCTGRPVHGCTLLIPKPYLAEFGLFDEKASSTQDYDLWFLMAGKYDFDYLPVPLARLRVHQQQGSARREHRLDAAEMAARFLRALEADDRLPPDERAELLLMVACRLRKKRYFAPSELAYRMSQALRPALQTRVRYRIHSLLDPVVWLRYQLLSIVRRFA